MQTGLVEIHGPMTREEKAIWDKVRQYKLECREAIAELEKLAAKKPDNRAIADELRRERKLWAKIMTVMPD
jgi:DNA-directed RNA polymerase specialized sigma subunit